jgi:hypothetical protein
MPEDAGKKTEIRDFLNRVSNGLGFIEDIWIEREIREANAACCLAKSLSGRKVSNLTELLEDDLRHCFEDNFFTFRFISAFPGSGKTSLLKYLHELIKLKKNYKSQCLTALLSLNDILSIGGTNSFSIKLYSHILCYTFWSLLNLENKQIEATRENLLRIIFSDSEIGELKAAANRDREDFDFCWNRLIGVKPLNFESYFFNVIEKITNVDPKFSFIYLIDELDGLMENSSYAGEARSFFRSLINRAHDKYNGKLRLTIYLVGTSEDVKRFLDKDAALKTRVAPTRIDLVAGRKEEFEQIRAVISERIRSAYKGCNDFPQAWQEISEIKLSIGSDYNSLRDFCQKYARKVTEIHENFFTSFDASYNLFENKARQLVEAEARKHWSQYLDNKAYTISTSPTTKILNNRAFDCYVELRHNDSCVARAFGEAKNYQLLSSHLKTFELWLQDVKFNPESNPPELAFLIAPDCASLLKRKIDLKNIGFLKSAKEVGPPNVPGVDINSAMKNDLTRVRGVDINSAMKNDLTLAFRGTYIQSTTIDKIINKRDASKFEGLDDLTTKMRFTNPVKEKLQKMEVENKIWFSS